MVGVGAGTVHVLRGKDKKRRLTSDYLEVTSNRVQPSDRDPSCPGRVRDRVM